MVHEHTPSFEDKIAERLARLSLFASITSLIVLLGVIFGNVLVLAVRVAINVVLAVIVNQGPAAAAIFGGISTAIGYYGRSRLLRRKERFNLRDEARDQALDQAGSVLQKAPDALRSRLGCSSSLSLGVFGVAALICLLTYLPPPLHVFGANLADATATPTQPTATATQPTATSGPITVIAPATIVPTSLPQPTATGVPSATRVPPTHTPIPMPTHTPTPTPVPPPPGNLLVLSSTPIDLGYACGYPFGSQTSSTFLFTITNNGGTLLYWTVVMPTGLALVQNYPATGTLLPNEGDSQNDYFWGTKERTSITITWGSSPNSEPNTATIPVTCTNPVP